MYKLTPTILWRIKNPTFWDVLNMGIIGKHDEYGTCWLAGGVLRGLIDRQDEIIDFDLFFSNTLATANTIVTLEQQGFEVAFKCPEGLLTTLKKDGVKIQCITKQLYRSAEELINTFDLHACRFCYDGEFVYTDKDAIRAVKRKETSINVLEFPVATFSRMLKYQLKGYKITKESIDMYVTSIYERGLNGLPIDKRLYID